MSSISKATEQVKTVFNGHHDTSSHHVKSSQKKNQNKSLRNKNQSNFEDPFDLTQTFLPADNERLRQREMQLQERIEKTKTQLQSDIDLVKSPKAKSGKSIKAQVKQTLTSAKDRLVAAKGQVVETVNSAKIEGLRDNLISAKEHIMGEVTKSELAKTKRTEPMTSGLSNVADKMKNGLDIAKGGLLAAKEQILGTKESSKTVDKEDQSGLISNVGDKMKETFAAAKEAVASVSITNIKGSLASAKGGLISAKERMFGATVEPIERGMPGRNHPHPERFEAKSSGLINKVTENVQGGLMMAKDNIFAVKDRLVGPSVEPIEGGMPGRNHPHPEQFEVQAPGLGTRIGSLISANQGLATKFGDNLQSGFITAKDSISSAKNRLFGTAIQPIEGGMPARNHPHPEQFEAKSEGMISKISENLQGGLGLAQSGILSAKNKIWGSTIQPIEGGMPGRYHPHPERFEAKSQGIVSKISDNLQDGFSSAKDGLLSAKNKVWGPSVQPIEGGMPGRYHPHAELYEVKAPGLISKITAPLQVGLESTKGGLVSMKNKIWGSSIQPIEGGMPGRNHPHPERFEAKSQGLVSKLTDSLPSGLVFKITDLSSVRNKIWGSTIEPIEGGMPGRNHPHPERFEAKTLGLISHVTAPIHSGLVSAKDSLVSAKNKIWGPSFEPIEGGMPGRYHPHPELFEAKNPGLAAKLSDNLQGGLVSAKDNIIAVKNRIWKETILPIEGGMPGRNHPHPERFEAKAPGLVTRISENLQGGLTTAKDGLTSAKNMVWGRAIQPIEGGMPGRYHPHPERFEAKAPGMLSKIEDSVKRIIGQPVEPALPQIQEIDEDDLSIQKPAHTEKETIEPVPMRSPSPKLVRSSELAELFDIEVDEDEKENESPDMGIVDQSAIEPTTEIVENETENEIAENETVEQTKPAEANKTESRGFFSKLKNLFSHDVEKTENYESSEN